jgi:hypothetical protein
MSLCRSLLALVLAAAALPLLGCSDVGYNPYIQNGGHRPIGKELEAIGPEAANDALSNLDAWFENTYN